MSQVNAHRLNHCGLLSVLFTASGGHPDIHLGTLLSLVLWVFIRLCCLHWLFCLHVWKIQWLIQNQISIQFNLMVFISTNSLRVPSGVKNFLWKFGCKWQKCIRPRRTEHLFSVKCSEFNRIYKEISIHGVLKLVMVIKNKFLSQIHRYWELEVGSSVTCLLLCMLMILQGIYPNNGTSTFLTSSPSLAFYPWKPISNTTVTFFPLQIQQGSLSWLIGYNMITNVLVAFDGGLYQQVLVMTAVLCFLGDSPMHAEITNNPKTGVSLNPCRICSLQVSTLGYKPSKTYVMQCVGIHWKKGLKQTSGNGVKKISQTHELWEIATKQTKNSFTSASKKYGIQDKINDVFITQWKMDKICNPFLQLKGFDGCNDTPVEVLHVITRFCRTKRKIICKKLQDTCWKTFQDGNSNDPFCFLPINAFSQEGIMELALSLGPICVSDINSEPRRIFAVNYRFSLSKCVFHRHQ
ncbi:uncharacterized protein VP01_3161g2 [Puccinia sorghi]|uniref:Uncharacterized protein n=1 Tax=Puccinia sorghi TaxID=27349 RepID=A0A0L6UYZ5_9BASI|nr:uncharacterized protein VP01_3161g2 [Puccinia sorghi]